jgi:hypothetical protein
MASVGRFPGMTIGNMRRLGPRGVRIWCGCGVTAYLDLERFDDDVNLLHDIRPRLRCKSCGDRPDMLQPDWRQANAHGGGRETAYVSAPAGQSG